MNIQRGIVHLLLVVVIVIVAIAGVGYWAYKNGQTNFTPSEKQNISTTPTANLPRDEVLRDWKTYSDPTIGYEFKYPPKWKLEEVYENLEYLNNILQQIKLTTPEGNYELIIGVKRLNDTYAITGRMGVGAGEFSLRDTVSVAGNNIQVSELIWEGKVKEIYYSNKLGPGTLELNNHQVVIEFSPTAKAYNDEVDLENLPETTTVTQILSTFKFTD
ncbi:hypothetical protein A2715_01055 [Candidatus Woesebacteria bacterium RIFCSPHIGHO2_01_FULL_39_32]|uniref:Uncharacterized protein n=2 Tax=Candidatus Woeseibacteriota TaxID=1752722 RepID=A0A0G0PR20_9BACT|nr:MAG: hypothetical protein UT61_C0008G0034 [Candidatus Woesebacteria bacterium GW2011_GWA1_39_8]OGM24495.1 MAG: hypothetical protein A2715_01055 [Candidatus Woesebacteria bacterium RIFCSPHIGHO2_01_FULL_39_32]OGM38874.1 MAG: hypothetical protein A3F01_03810 [Candidatus Woesebacteria bacterium RIFCSPHIGHO2_12_FULL_38_11]OGM63801.1 MAG: hypothetical protein A2893_02390 [Candidatus Woesebacteria bacterium RIFCSPLOWO2_01_FULL_39_25]